MDQHHHEWPHLDVELQVLVHGVDVVEYVLGNSRDDAHELRVVQLALRTKERRESSKQSYTLQTYQATCFYCLVGSEHTLANPFLKCSHTA